MGKMSVKIYLFIHLRWDGDYWLPVRESIVAAKTLSEAKRLFGATKKDNVDVAVIGTADKNVEIGILLDKPNYALQTAITKGDKRLIARAAMIDPSAL